ncbi:MAG: VWA domain-containing protein [Mycobacterium sp.]
MRAVLSWRRRIDNVGFFSVQDIDAISDQDPYDLLLREFPPATSFHSGTRQPRRRASAPMSSVRLPSTQAAPVRQARRLDSRTVASLTTPTSVLRLALLPPANKCPS